MSQIRFLDGLKEIDQKKTRIRNLLTQIFNVYEIFKLSTIQQFKLSTIQQLDMKPSIVVQNQ